MSRVDMNLDELKKYKGTNPKPKDYDAYWKKALDEMNSVDSNVEFIPAKFQSKNSECYDMYFTGVKNARIHVKHLRPKNAQGKLPAVLLFHGYGARSDDFSALLKWTNEGYAVFALDCRGQRGESEDTGGVKGNTTNGHIMRGLYDKNPEKLIYRQIFLDTAQLAKLAASFDFIDKDNIFATGESQGGALTVCCAALSGCIKKAAIIYPYLSDYKRVWNMGRDQDAYENLRAYFRNFDPLHETEEEIFTRLGYIDTQFMAEKVNAEILMLSGFMDTTCPPSTQFSVYNKLKYKKDLIIYPDFAHEPLPESGDIIMTFFNS